jgi:hypothetical protein
MAPRRRIEKKYHSQKQAQLEEVKRELTARMDSFMERLGKLSSAVRPANEGLDTLKFVPRSAKRAGDRELSVQVRSAVRSAAAACGS